LIVSSLFCFSWPVKTEFFDENKSTHPKWVLVVTKKFQPEQMKSRILRGGKLLVIFGPCNPNISQKEGSGNFESMTTFALLIEIYLAWEFHKFSPSRSWETSEKGVGGPLKGIQQMNRLKVEYTHWYWLLI
jgi:hypothetical protein